MKVIVWLLVLNSPDHGNHPVWWFEHRTPCRVEAASLNLLAGPHRDQRYSCEPWDLRQHWEIVDESSNLRPLQH
jgi:hypothetical protein